MFFHIFYLPLVSIISDTELAMKNTFTFIFYVKRSKINSYGKTNVYLRITVNGKRAEISINRKVDIEKWDSKSGRLLGKSIEAQQMNRYIDTISNKIYKIHQNLLDNDLEITARKIIDIYSGRTEKPKMLLEVFQNHNEQVEKLIGKDFAPGTLERYKTAKKHVGDFIRHEYQLQDIRLQDINHKFISAYEYYLKTVKNCAHNTSIKYITNFKKIVRIAYANGWIDKDPFLNWKARLKTVDREFLTKDEIERIINKEFSVKRIELVRDIFIFSCFTGLAYIDVKNLTREDIVMGIDGNNWIKIKRQKTKTVSNVPLLPIAEDIINKYQNNTNFIKGDHLLPVSSNQKMNAYLKEIADLCEIQKNLTFHLARHTFATTVTLTNGVPIESVSKMLGHKSLKTTQHYAKILDKKVSDDMNILKRKLGSL